MDSRIDWPFVSLVITFILLIATITLITHPLLQEEAYANKKFCEYNDMEFKQGGGLICKGLDNGEIVYKRFEVYNHERYFLKDG